MPQAAISVYDSISSMNSINLKPASFSHKGGFRKKSNDLYHNEWSLLHNYFYPVKLIDKIRIQSKIKKKHQKPLTPYQRLISCDYIDDAQKAKLKQTFESLNPFKLKQSIEQKLKNIFKHVNLKNSKKTGTI